MSLLGKENMEISHVALLNAWHEHPLYLSQEDVRLRPEAYRLPPELVLSALGMDPVKVLSPEDARDMGVIAEGMKFQELNKRGQGVWVDGDHHEETEWINEFAYLRTIHVDDLSGFEEWLELDVLADPDDQAEFRDPNLTYDNGGYRTAEYDSEEYAQYDTDAVYEGMEV